MSFLQFFSYWELCISRRANAFLPFFLLDTATASRLSGHKARGRGLLPEGYLSLMATSSSVYTAFMHAMNRIPVITLSFIHLAAYQMYNQTFHVEHLRVSRETLVSKSAAKHSISNGFASILMLIQSNTAYKPSDHDVFVSFILFFRVFCSGPIASQIASEISKAHRPLEPCSVLLRQGGNASSCISVSVLSYVNP